MRLLAELRSRFQAALSAWVDDPADLVAMVGPAQDARFGDYQANSAMPLGKRLGRPPREVAADIIARLDVGDLCQPPEIAGPGFINLRLRDDWLIARVQAALRDERLGVAVQTPGRKFVIDYSSPNVAKPMHVGHIRSTVIGDALCRTLRFLGHRVISDNHLGDWGTQFGMIIYGFKHFVDRDAYRAAPVAELSRLYKLVNQLVEYHEGRALLPRLEADLARRESELARRAAELIPTPGHAGGPTDSAADKPAKKTLNKLRDGVRQAQEEIAALRKRLAAVEGDPVLASLAAAHPQIATAVLEETARLHAGDAENLRLWNEFLPPCRAEIQHIYDRLGIRFDVEHGESFYHEQLAAVAEDFARRGLARESEGALCIFLDGFATPMIIRKKDGAFLYATSDLATIQFRMQQWHPDAILYVVDHRQSEHFEKLFAAARLWGYTAVELQHISFGTVLGEDGRPFKTRAGDTVGLESLLEEAVQRAYAVVAANDDAKPDGPELSDAERRKIATAVGLGAIKYADLSHNRTSDYVFSYDKMLALNGNTATYMQYSYARVNGIFNKGGVEVESLRRAPPAIQLGEAAERRLALELVRFADALDNVLEDYRPNQLTAYLFELTKVFFTFYEQCPVLKAEAEATRYSRLALCDLTARTIKQGLQLLGIDVVDRM